MFVLKTNLPLSWFPQVGGSNALGTWGYMEFCDELQTQMTESDVHFDEVVMACGSGATTGG